MVTELLGSQPQNAETPTPKPAALEVNPYSERFNPGKYIAYSRKLKSTTVLVVAEGNEAVIKIIKKARSMALRHLPRTHRIDVQWFFEVCAHPRVCMLYVSTKQQIADLMTKAPSNPQVWAHLLDIAQIRGSIQREAGLSNTTSTAALLATPPGLSLPLAAVNCSECGFDTTTPGSQCLCDWT